jgi:hypothetical protein
MLGGYFESFIMNKYGFYDILGSVFKYTLRLDRCTWFQDNNLDFWFEFCHYLLSKTECWVIYPHLKFWNHTQKENKVRGLGFCLED